MKSVLLLLTMLILIISCSGDVGKARIIIPVRSADGNPFEYGAVIYAVNITRPELTRRIPFNNATKDIEIDLASGEYVFQAIAAYENSGVAFKCAENLDAIHVSDGSFHDIDLDFRADNCFNKPVFMNHTRYSSASTIDSLYLDFCPSGAEVVSGTVGTGCATSSINSVLIEYIADGQPGISYCINTTGDFLTPYPIIMGNSTIAPAGYVFAIRFSGFTSNDCLSGFVRTLAFPKGLDTVPSAGTDFKLIADSSTYAYLFLGFF